MAGSNLFYTCMFADSGYQYRYIVLTWIGQIQRLHFFYHVWHYTAVKQLHFVNPITPQSCQLQSRQHCTFTWLLWCQRWSFPFKSIPEVGSYLTTRFNWTIGTCQGINNIWRRLFEEKPPEVHSCTISTTGFIMPKCLFSFRFVAIFRKAIEQAHRGIKASISAYI